MSAEKFVGFGKEEEEVEETPEHLAEVINHPLNVPLRDEDASPVADMESLTALFEKMQAAHEAQTAALLAEIKSLKTQSAATEERLDTFAPKKKSAGKGEGYWHSFPGVVTYEGKFATIVMPQGESPEGEKRLPKVATMKAKDFGGSYVAPDGQNHVRFPNWVEAVEPLVIRAFCTHKAGFYVNMKFQDKKGGLYKNCVAYAKISERHHPDHELLGKTIFPDDIPEYVTCDLFLVPAATRQCIRTNKTPWEI